MATLTKTPTASERNEDSKSKLLTFAESNLAFLTNSGDCDDEFNGSFSSLESSTSSSTDDCATFMIKKLDSKRTKRSLLPRSKSFHKNSISSSSKLLGEDASTLYLLLNSSGKEIAAALAENNQRKKKWTDRSLKCKTVYGKNGNIKQLRRSGIDGIGRSSHRFD